MACTHPVPGLPRILELSADHQSVVYESRFGWAATQTRRFAIRSDREPAGLDDPDQCQRAMCTVATCLGRIKTVHSLSRLSVFLTTWFFA
jgi:hypothetical protein